MPSNLERAPWYHGLEICSGTQSLPVCPRLPVRGGSVNNNNNNNKKKYLARTIEVHRLPATHFLDNNNIVSYRYIWKSVFCCLKMSRLSITLASITLYKYALFTEQNVPLQW